MQVLYIYLYIVNYVVEVLNLPRQMGEDKVARKLGEIAVLLARS